MQATERRENSCRRAFHCQDGGFSTVGMVLAILISLSLIFTSAQVYRVQSASANVQNVADAAALAAENQVASFYVVAQVCDAICLSLSLTGIGAAGLGVACLCTPFTGELSGVFLEAAQKIFSARDKFSREASAALNKLQKLLPFLAAAQSYSVALANSGSEGSYFGCAILLPFEGTQIDVPQLDGSSETMDAINSEKEAIAQAAQEAEDAAEQADAHKRAAFMADCGNNPGYCMYQRAESLAGLSGGSNPLYSSVDAWNFSVALRRAQAYYAQRLAQEAPANSSVNEQANSFLRTQFYQYACRQLEMGYVHEDPVSGSFSCNFPTLPRNTAQMRETSLYTDGIYPVSSKDGNYTMHAWDGCPQLLEDGLSGSGSIQVMEDLNYDRCPVCEFSASSMGQVAQASSSIQNGFEYHYLIVAEEAKSYEQATERLGPSKQQVQSKTESLLEKLKDLLDQAAKARIDVKPPGRYGAVAIVASTDGVPASGMFPTGFVSGGGTLGTRAAIAGATLAEDDSSETKSVISSLLDGFTDEPGGISGVSMVLGLWSSLLKAYTNGQEALSQGIKDTLGRIPFAGKAGLGSWAAGKLEEAIAAAGLQPAQVNAYKPVLVNSAHILAADSSHAASALLQVKLSFASVPVDSSPLAALSSFAGSLTGAAAVAGEQKLLVATVELLGVDSKQLPFSIALPASASEATTSTIDGIFGKIGSLGGSSSGERRWE